MTRARVTLAVLFALVFITGYLCAGIVAKQRVIERMVPTSHLCNTPRCHRMWDA